MANRMSLFYAEATPMLKTLSNATTKFVSEVRVTPFPPLSSPRTHPCSSILQPGSVLCLPLVVIAFHVPNLTHAPIHFFPFVHLFHRMEWFKQRSCMILFALDKQPDLTLAAVLCWFLPSSAVSASTPHFFPYLLALDQP